MNAKTPETDRRSQTGTPNNVVSFSTIGRRYRQRNFGIGYGSSSGYALDKRYTTDWGQILFRCA